MRTTVRVSLWVDNNPVWSAEEDISDRAARRIHEKRFKAITLAAVREIMAQVLADEREESGIKNQEARKDEQNLPQEKQVGRETVEKGAEAPKPAPPQATRRPNKLR